MSMKLKTRPVEHEFVLAIENHITMKTGKRILLADLDDRSVRDLVDATRLHMYRMAGRELPPEPRPVEILPKDVQAFLESLNDSSIPDLYRSKAKSLVDLHGLPF